MSRGNRIVLGRSLPTLVAAVQRITAHLPPARAPLCHDRRPPRRDNHRPRRATAAAPACRRAAGGQVQPFVGQRATTRRSRIFAPSSVECGAREASASVRSTGGDAVHPTTPPASRWCAVACTPARSRRPALQRIGAARPRTPREQRSSSAPCMRPRPKCRTAVRPTFTDRYEIGRRRESELDRRSTQHGGGEMKLRELSLFNFT